MDSIAKDYQDHNTDKLPLQIYNEIASALAELNQPSTQQQQHTSESLSRSSLHNIKISPSLYTRLINWICNHHLFRQDHTRIIHEHLRYYFSEQIFDWNSTICFGIIFIPLIYCQFTSLDLSNTKVIDFMTSSPYNSNSSSSNERILITFSLFFLIFALLTSIRISLLSEQQSNQNNTNYKWISCLFKRIPWRAKSKETSTHLIHNYADQANTHLLEQNYQKNQQIDKSKRILRIMSRILLSLIIIVLANGAPIFIQQNFYKSNVEQNQSIIAIVTGFLIILSTNVFSFILVLIFKVTKSTSNDFQLWLSLGIEAVTQIPVCIYMMLHIGMLSSTTASSSNTSTSSTSYWLTRDSTSFPCAVTQFEYAVVGLYLGSVIFSILKSLPLCFLRIRMIKLNFVLENSMKSQQYLLLICMSFVCFFAFPLGIIAGFLVLKIEKCTLERVAIDVKHGMSNQIIPLGVRFLGVVLFATALMKVQVYVQSGVVTCGIYVNGGIGNSLTQQVNDSNIANTIYDVISSLPMSFVLAVCLLTVAISSRSKKVSSSINPRSALHCGRAESDKRADDLQQKLQQLTTNLNYLLPRSMRNDAQTRQNSYANNNPNNNSNNSSNNNNININTEQIYEDDYNMITGNTQQPNEMSFAQMQSKQITPQTQQHQKQLLLQQQHINPSSTTKRMFFRNNQQNTSSLSKFDQGEIKKTSDEWSTQNQSPLLRQEWNNDNNITAAGGGGGGGGGEHTDSRALLKSQNQLNKSSFNQILK